MGKRSGKQIIEGGMDVRRGPANDLDKGAAGKAGGQNLIAPKAIGGQSGEVEGEGESDEE